MHTMNHILSQHHRYVFALVCALSLVLQGVAYAQQTPQDTLYEHVSDDETYADLTADPIEAFINDYHQHTSDDLMAEDIWTRIRHGFEIPEIESEYTSKHEQWYASRPDYVKRMTERSQKYLFHIVEEVEKRGMPTEIALLPMIESAYNPRAYSQSHASGIWQFVPTTGKYFGLKQNWWADNRRDVLAATKAALTYLQKLHGMFGSWDLALAAYNAGEGTLQRAIERNRKLGLPTSYQHLSLSDETKNYVPKLQAIKNIVFDPERFGLTLTDIPNQPYFTHVLAPKQIDAKLAAQLAEVSDEEFSALNPSYNRPVIVSNNEVHQLLIPVWSAERFRINLANYDRPLSRWTTYRAKRGERIDYIAKKFDMDVNQLRRVNNLSTNAKIAASRPLLVASMDDDSAPLNTQDLEYQDLQQDSVASNEPKSRKTVTYRVKKGDTLSLLAKRFGTNKQALIITNGLKSLHLKAGQTLLVNLHKVKANRSRRPHQAHLMKQGATKGAKTKIRKPMKKTKSSSSFIRVSSQRR